MSDEKVTDLLKVYCIALTLNLLLEFFVIHNSTYQAYVHE